MADDQTIEDIDNNEPNMNTEKNDDELSWEDASADLEKQKEMLNEERSDATQTMDDGDLEKEVEGGSSRSLEMILDIPLHVKVELGRSRMLINDLLQLGQGSVIELNKLVGEPLEVLVNDKLVARGEVVVVNEKFGVRLTDIISPTERVEQLK